MFGKSYLLKSFIVFSLLTYLAIPAIAIGQVTIDNPLASDSLEDLIDGIITFIFWVATALAPLMILIAAFYFLTSGGNPQQVSTAKKIILYTLIGYTIIIISKGLIIILKDILGVT